MSQPDLNKRTLTLALAALGVVYGDIGTSPLYALKECFSSQYGVALSESNILGILSLIFWSLIIVINVKYLTFLMRADNKGEGGIMALIALSVPKIPSRGILGQGWLILIGLFGAALLYGDGMITPAVTVLSAVEGLSVATSVFDPFILPITLAVLVGLFLAQSGGTQRIGVTFGPMILIWFLTIAIVGVPWIFENPAVLKALNPMYAYQFIIENGMIAFYALGAVFLCVTGGEAMYADMGHFGARPIRMAWYAIAFPCLVLNYFGQGALLLSKGDAVVANPFFSMVPDWFLYPMVFIAMCAGVIASQALITGIYSLTHQATQLGFLPRFQVIHTSDKKEGQIYLPEVNRIMMVGCLTLVLFFQKSSNLTAAYGVAVTGTTTITSLFFFLVMRRIWNWSLFTCLAIIVPLISVDLVFLSANLGKIDDGGWIPLCIGFVATVLMVTWRQGRFYLSQAMLAKSMALKEFLALLKDKKPYRVPGTAMVLTANRDIAPPTLLHHLKHNQVLHKTILLLTVVVKNSPFVTPDERLEITDMGEGIHRVIAKYGYIQRPNVSEIIRLCRRDGLDIDKKTSSFYLGRETLIPTGPSKMARWRKEVFAFMSKNAQSATNSFRIPPDQVVEIGLQLEI